MPFREILAGYYENHWKHIHTLCGNNENFLMLKQEENIFATLIEDKPVLNVIRAFR